jgi:DNA-binding LacI/PurR family transcriptional regulator
MHHLIRLGHRRIGHVGGPARYLHAVYRRTVWAEVLRDACLPQGPYEEADFSAAGGAEDTRMMLDAADRPTAILYGSDLMAIAGLAAGQQRGLRIPGDLSVVGFDDGEISAHLPVPLSTVRTDAYGWGRAAVAALRAYVGGEEVGDIALPAAQFILRDSIGPAPRAPRRTPRPAAHS